MSKKNYVAFASMFASMKPQKEDYSRAQYSARMAQWLADVAGATAIFQDENPAFNKSRFLTACGAE